MELTKEMKEYLDGCVSTYMDNVKDVLLVMLIGFMEENRTRMETGKPSLQEEKREAIEALIRGVEQGEIDGSVSVLQVVPERGHSHPQTPTYTEETATPEP